MEATLTRILRTEILDRVLTPDRMSEYVKATESARKRPAIESRNLRAALASVETKITRLWALYEDAGIDQTALKERLSKAEAERARISAEIAAEKPVPGIERSRLEKLREAVAQVEGRALREVLAALGVRVVVEFGEIAVSTRLSSCIDLSSTAAH